MVEFLREKRSKKKKKKKRRQQQMSDDPVTLHNDNDVWVFCSFFYLCVAAVCILLVCIFCTHRSVSLAANILLTSQMGITSSDHHHHNRFTALFLGPPGWAGARRELPDFVLQGKINRGRYIDHPAGCHSVRTSQCPPPPSPIFLQAGCPSYHPTNSVKALKTTHSNWH